MYTTTSFTPLLLALLTMLSTLALAMPEVVVLRSALDTHIAQQHEVNAHVRRQAPVAPALPNDPRCLDYANTANIATVGGNSSYRTAYLQLSPLGTFTNQAMFNAAQAKLPAMMFDVDLNAQCQNQSERAALEAVANFTSGSVLGLRGVETLDSPPGKIVGSDMSLLAIVGAMLIITAGLWGCT